MEIGSVIRCMPWCALRLEKAGEYLACRCWARAVCPQQPGRGPQFEHPWKHTSPSFQRISWCNLHNTGAPRPIRAHELPFPYCPCPPTARALRSVACRLHGILSSLLSFDSLASRIPVCRQSKVPPLQVFPLFCFKFIDFRSVYVKMSLCVLSVLFSAYFPTETWIVILVFPRSVELFSPHYFSRHDRSWKSLLPLRFVF